MDLLTELVHGDVGGRTHQYLRLAAVGEVVHDGGGSHSLARPLCVSGRLEGLDGSVSRASKVSSVSRVIVLLGLLALVGSIGLAGVSTHRRPLNQTQRFAQHASHGGHLGVVELRQTGGLRAT